MLRNNMGKLMPFVLIIAMLFCSLFTMSVNAANNTIKINDEMYSVECYSWQSPDLHIESRETELTKQEVSELVEALENASYDEYEIIAGIDYEIKRVSLKYGYTIDFISIYQNSSVMRANEYKTGTARVSIKDLNGQEVGYVTLTATYWWATNTVSFSSASINSGNPPAASWSNVSYSTAGSSTSTMWTVSSPKLNINGGGSASYYIAVGCDSYGNISIINAG